MKKRFAILLTLATILCLLPFGAAFAQEPSNTITPMSAITAISGLTCISGSSYRAWASTQTYDDENLTASYTLYRKIGSTLVYVTSNTASTYGTYVKAQGTITLSAGTYELHWTCSGDTQSSRSARTYIIS